MPATAPVPPPFGPATLEPDSARASIPVPSSVSEFARSTPSLAAAASEVTVEVAEIPEDQLPRPVGYKLLVEPLSLSETSRGGIAWAEETLRAKETLMNVGLVRRMGEDCYNHPKFNDRPPWVKEGDWILYSPYAGAPTLLSYRDAHGEEKTIRLRLLNDDDPWAVLPDPTKIIILA